MVELVSAIARSLVENPDAVQVTEEEANGTTVLIWVKSLANRAGSQRRYVLL